MSEVIRLLDLHNERISFILNGDASGQFIDNKSGRRLALGRVATQEYGPMYDTNMAIFYRHVRAYAEEYPGRFSGQAVGANRVRFTLLGRLGKQMGQFTVSYRLDGQWLEVNVEQIDECLPSLVFPTALEADQLVLPHGGAGSLYREPFHGRVFLDAFGNLSMPWFGGLVGDDGWIGIFEQGYHDAGMHILGLSACPGWVRSMGAWKSPRVIRLRHTQGGYVGMAKVYRRWAQEHGLLKTLRQRLEETPQLDNLIGGRILSIHEGRTLHKESAEEHGRRVPPELADQDGKVRVHATHRQAAQIAQDARSLGWKRGVLNIRGWIKGGYDESHPDIWPPEPAFGTIEDLKALMTNGPIVGSLHDNYQDIYRQCPSFPRRIMRLPGGDYRFGGLWSGGQAYLLCAQAVMDCVRRNWRLIREHLNPSAIFIDTTTASPLYECYDPAHPMSRADDAHWKCEAIKVFKADRVLFGTEETRDFAAPLVDWYETRHHHHTGTTIPLWSLVYHDACITTRYMWPMGEDDTKMGARNYLTDMLWGYILFFGMHNPPEEWPGLRESFARTLAADQWNRRIGTDEMTNHRFIGDDFLVERTEFSSGASIIVNYANQPRTVEGKTIEAGGYLIVE